MEFLKKHIGFFVIWTAISLFAYFGSDTKTSNDFMMAILSGLLITGIGYGIYCLAKNSPSSTNNTTNSSSNEAYNIYKDKGIKQSLDHNHTVYTSPKQQYKDNKRNGIVSCPKCGSQSITTTNKKISVGKGVTGAAVGSLVNPIGTVVGAAVGATHSKKIYNVCMNCGHKWKP